MLEVLIRWFGSGLSGRVGLEEVFGEQGTLDKRLGGL